MMGVRTVLALLRRPDDAELPVGAVGGTLVDPPGGGPVRRQIVWYGKIQLFEGRPTLLFIEDGEPLGDEVPLVADGLVEPLVGDRTLGGLGEEVDELPGLALIVGPPQLAGQVGVLHQNRDPRAGPELLVPTEEGDVSGGHLLPLRPTSSPGPRGQTPDVQLPRGMMLAHLSQRIVREEALDSGDRDRLRDGLAVMVPGGVAGRRLDQNSSTVVLRRHDRQPLSSSVCSADRARYSPPLYLCRSFSSFRRTQSARPKPFISHNRREKSETSRSCP